MLQPTYFQQNQNSGTTNTKLLEEKDRVLNSLASISSNIETPNSLNPEGRYIFMQQRLPIPSACVLNLSGAIEYYDVGGVPPFTSAQITPTPISIYQPAAQQPTNLLSRQEAFKLVKKSFESYKKDRQKYSLQRAKEIMSFIDDDNNE